jgi:tRNA-splicing ligase RtcB
VWVVRKGCTPAFPGQQGFVGATMGEPSVILEGVDGEGARDLLYSTVHGAGRVMSRTEAAGRSRKRWSCPHCGWTQERGTHVGARRQCPRCGRGGLVKRWVLERPGKVDWAATTAALRDAGIQLRGGAADEAPDAYKRLDAVLAAHTDAVRVLHELRPIGVAMAGADTFDPYKD